ncbi:MAG TPA: aminopeptidase P family N-terminal domain-containing protein, partial [Puia sp.]|nr:aminopeptidase P family N-terminal domain-containing protein [Puia sp.]
MSLKRRSFIRLTAGSVAAGTALLHGLSSFTKRGLEDLRPMTDDVEPITLEERLSRIQKAQRLMTENKIEALVLDTGTSMQYFTGVGWWPSERTMVAVIPAKGEIKYVGPAF